MTCRTKIHNNATKSYTSFLYDCRLNTDCRFLYIFVTIDSSPSPPPPSPPRRRHSPTDADCNLMKTAPRQTTPYCSFGSQLPYRTRSVSEVKTGQRYLIEGAAADTRPTAQPAHQSFLSL
ncbi:hypothetical protein E2C01_025799 [Portunus trituberculatus]|uniref:Uncharacterized protein n=1 Tax=Portunus trituberculatus TaxID=210409 RepID=A0A5B7EGX3_PORTR|nr:hypothetical protein [Portunus trituberculatus]